MRVLLLLACSSVSSCALLSGLSQLTVSDGGPSDASSDASSEVIIADAPSSDTGPEEASDSGRDAGSALQFTSGCAYANADSVIALSGTSFTVQLWVRLDAASPKGLTLAPIVWKGGRNTGEPGWSLDIQNSTLGFCVSSVSASACTSPAYPMVVGHLVHVVVATATNTTGRSVSMYARDVSAGETTHMLVSQSSPSTSTWTDNATFTLGAATPSCTAPSSVTIDDLRVFDIAPSNVMAMDAMESTNLPCNTLALLADFRFDEGSGPSTTDCTGNQTLTLSTQGVHFIPSPFP